MATARSGNKQSFLPALARKRSSQRRRRFPRSLGSKRNAFSRRSLGNVRAELVCFPRSLGSKKEGKIAVVGAGHMGSALAAGLLQGGVSPKRLIVADRSLPKTEPFFKRGATTALNAWYPTDWGHIIFLAVKPDSAADTLAHMKPYLKGKVLVSMVAGLSLKKLQTLAGDGAHVARIMPNLPVRYGAGVVGVCFDTSMPQRERRKLLRIMEGLGLIFEVKREADLELLTVLSGSGPGTVSYLIDAMASFGEKNGFSKKDAERLARETFHGTVAYLKESGVSARSMQKSVATKGGVTEVILREFSKAGVERGLARGLRKGSEKIRAMRRARA